jgi:hypothetical protein
MRALLLAGALAMASPVQAGESAELSCVPDGYSAAQKSRIDGLLANGNIFDAGENPAMDAIAEVVVGSASDCATQFDWSEAELKPALLHEFGRLMEVGFIRHGALSAGEIAQVDAALAKGDRRSLWAALEKQLAMGMAGEGELLNDASTEVFGLFIIETGLGLDEAKAEQVGVYLAAKAMQRVSARDFAAAQ